MSVRIVTPCERGAPKGVAQYWSRLCNACADYGIAVEWATLKDWQAKVSRGNPAEDILIVDNQDVMDIDVAYAVISVQHGCAAENGLRNESAPLSGLGIRQAEAAKRPRTYWVSCSDFAAHFCHKHYGVVADRIIFGGVDTSAFFPGERQRLKRSSRRPVVGHTCKDVNKGKGAVARVAALLSDFEFREVYGVPSEMPDLLLGVDMFLCLSRAEGLPTALQEAMATGLACVSTDVGICWPTHDIVTVLPWQKRDEAGVVAEAIRSAWACHTGREARRFALRWYSLETFGHQWVAAIASAAKQFGVGA